MGYDDLIENESLDAGYYVMIIGLGIVCVLGLIVVYALVT